MISRSTRNSMLIAVFATALLLLVPAIAMQVTDEVNWTGGDFVAAGGLLFGAATPYVFAASAIRRPWKRVAVATLILCGLGVVWAELALGLF